MLTKLCNGGFDQAPVVSKGEPIGLIPRSRLEELLETQQPLLLTDRAIVTASVFAASGLDEVLGIIEVHSMARIIDRTTGKSSGFFTLSDLNKHPVRAAIYPLFAEMESELAAMVDYCYTDPWDWLKMLNEDKQARLAGYWEVSKRKNVDVGPIAAMTLSELVQVAGCTESLCSTLGFAKKSKWDEFLSGLIDLRNSIMHSVRPIFFTKDDVTKTRERLTRILTLLCRLEEVSDGQLIKGIRA